MNLLNKLRVLFLLVAVLLVACNKENLDVTVPDNPNFQPDTVAVNSMIGAVRSNPANGLELGCLTINYPFDLTTESDSIITITSQAEFEAALELEAPNRVVDFVFPLDVTDGDGNTLQVNNNTELGTSFASCIPTTGWDTSMSTNETLPAFLLEELCFDLVFPVDLQDGNGNSYTANDNAEFVNLLATVDPLYFTLPFTVVDQAGTEIAIDDMDRFFELVYLCDGISPPVTGNGFEVQGFACNELQFPFDVEKSDGSIVTVNDANQYTNLILNGEGIELQFPFSLLDPNGNVLVIANFDDLIASFAVCGVIIDIIDNDSCGFADAHVLLFFNALNIYSINKYEYDLNYPVTLIVDGNTVVLNNDDDYLPAIGGSPSNLPEVDIVYPVTITQFGRDIVLTSDTDVCDFYQTLDEPCENKPAHIQFFFNEGGGVPGNCAYYIDFPVEIDRNGVTIQVQTREDYLAELNASPTAYDDIELVYPVSIFRFIDGQQFTFTSDEDICDYLDTCEW